MSGTDIKSGGDMPHESNSIEAKDVAIGDVASIDEKSDLDWMDPKEQKLRRDLGARQIFMISLGTAIGTGLWIGSGSALAKGGPAGLWLGFTIVGFMVLVFVQSLGEMATLFPVPESFTLFATRFVDPSVGVGLGWLYWVDRTLTIPTEFVAANIVIQYWTEQVPVAAWLAIFMVLTFSINYMGVRAYGESEFIFTSIKVTAIIVFIIIGIVIAAGGAPDHEYLGFHYWYDPGSFAHGFKGFLSVLITATFSYGGIELTAIVAGETSNPTRNVPKAIRSVFIRLCMFYMVGTLIVSIIVPYTNKQLLGGSETNASPFVIAFKDHGLAGLSHLMNAIILISALSCGSSAVYASSRVLAGLGRLGIAPRFVAKTDKYGRPYWGIIIATVLGGGLSFLNISDTGAEVFSWFSSLVGLGHTLEWITILITSLRFRAGWKASGYSPKDLPYCGPILFPWSVYFAILIGILIVISKFYLSIWPLGDEQSAATFFSNFISVPLYLILILGYKLIVRPKFVRASEMDVVSGQRVVRDGKPEERAWWQTIFAYFIWA
ncbi:MAG: glyceraldehyde-3-phosphate dehydrogenase 1 [Cirrosporium novae-zelandiae]|nr:MAG: glyceraldehyde-3-phosphate dehydrogenase 1 [Cirrosporium novae-zelandiae]